MCSEGRLMLAIAIFGSIIALLATIAFDWAEWTCRLPSPTSESGKPFALGPGGCFEFWFYRYQTLIGALVALMAAIFAWIGVMKQVQMAEQQVRAASKQNSIAVIPIINLRIQSLEKIARSFGRINRYEVVVSQRMNDCKNLLSELQKQITKRDLVEERRTRVALKGAMQKYDSTISAIRNNCMRQKHLGDEIMLTNTEKHSIEKFINSAKAFAKRHEGILAVCDDAASVNYISDEIRDTKIETAIDAIGKGVEPQHFDKMQGYKLASSSYARNKALLDANLISVEGQSYN